MEIKTTDLGLKPVEALYLLNLSREEVFNTENALTAVIAYLCERRILNIKHGHIKLSKRGYRFRADSNNLDPVEKGLTWFVEFYEHKKITPLIKKADFFKALLRKKMIIRKRKSFLSVFSFFKNEFELSDLGQEQVTLLLRMRTAILLHGVSPSISSLSTFPSLSDKINYNKLGIIRAYSQRVLNSS